MRIKDEQFFITINKFLTIYLPKHRSCSPNTIKAYRETINLFLDFMRTDKQIGLTQMSFEYLCYQNICDFLDWLQDTRQCCTNTRNLRLMVIRAFSKYAVFLDPARIAQLIEIEKVPMKKSVSRIVEFLSEEALKLLLEQPDVSKNNGFRDRFFMILMYDLGARCQETLNLRIRDIELQSPAPFVYITGKGKKPRTVPLMGKTVEHYVQYLEKFHPAESRQKDDFLFYTKIKGERTRMSEANTGAFFKRYGEDAKKCNRNIDIPNRVHPHQIRHTRAMHLYRGGMPLVLLSEFLGHSDINTTQIYAYADSEMKRTALQKVNQTASSPKVVPIWVDDENMIRKLYGLK